MYARHCAWPWLTTAPLHRRAHTRCLARWQLQQAGRDEVGRAAVARCVSAALAAAPFPITAAPLASCSRAHAACQAYLDHAHGTCSAPNHAWHLTTSNSMLLRADTSLPAPPQERCCRFCHAALPSWKAAFATPPDLPPAIPVMSIHFNNTTYWLQASRGGDSAALCCNSARVRCGSCCWVWHAARSALGAHSIKCMPGHTGPG